MLTITLAIVFLGLPLQAQMVNDGVQKKLIEFGWYSPYLNQYAADAEKYDIEPFDGVGLKLTEDACNGYVFRVADWRKVTEQAKASNLEWAKIIGSKNKSRENFLVLYGASQMDWFSEEDWLAVAEQLRFAAQIAKAAGCAGILWDPEPYGSNPWKYSEQTRQHEKTIEQYAAIIRQRGQQFVQILQIRWPTCVKY